MKILIGSLLFATAFFINFLELNSSPTPIGAGSSRRNVNVDSSHQGTRVPERTYIYILGKTIEVDVVKMNNQYVAVDCRVYGSKNKIPTTHARRKKNFMTQPFFKNYQGSQIRIVTYIEEDEDEKKILLGAKLPPTGHGGYKLDDPYGLDPDQSKWFITYKNLDYIVEYDAASDTATDVKLWSRQNVRPDPEKIIENWRKYHYLHFGGLYILVFKNIYNVIEGAALDPFWTYRPGGEHAHLNPYLNYQRNHQINIQKYHPIEENPDPRENVHQNRIIVPQHDAYHQRNFNPYEHLYTNQTLDHYHNPHYAQQNGHPPPAFDPNQNWNYPSHHPSSA